MKKKRSLYVSYVYTLSYEIIQGCVSPSISFDIGSEKPFRNLAVARRQTDVRNGTYGVVLR